MKLALIMRTVPMFAVAATLAASCKSTGASDTKDLPIDQINTLTLQQWVSACQTELANPKTGAASRADLIELANTTDCATAYPVIKSVLNQYRPKS